MRASCLAVTALAVSCTLQTIAWSHTVTPLPAVGFADIVVDDRHGRVFVTQFDAAVLVFDLAGNAVGRIEGQSGAAGMALNRSKSRLFVAQRTGDAIAEIDTRTLREVGRDLLGLDGGCPGSLTVLGNRVWFGFSCQDACMCGAGGRGGIASLRARRGTVETYAGLGFPYYTPIVAADRRLRNVLVAGDGDLSPTSLYRYRVRSGVPLLETSAFYPGSSSNLADVAILPRARQVLTASGAPYQVNAFSLDDFSSVGAYVTGPYPKAVAVTSDERFVAAGILGIYSPDVFVFPTGDPTPVNVYELERDSPTAPYLMDGGLAFDEAGTTLFAVTGSFFDEPSALHVIAMPLVPTTTSTSTSTTTTTVTTTSSTTLPVPCGNADVPQCAGECPSGETCVWGITAGFSSCVCAPDPACGLANRTCGGGCPGTMTCVPIHTTACACE